MSGVGMYCRNNYINRIDPTGRCSNSNGSGDPSAGNWGDNSGSGDPSAGNGNTIGQVTTAGNAITQTFDTRNRMLTQSYTVSGGSSTITNTYDLMGRLHTTTQNSASLTYVYDDLGRNTKFRFGDYRGVSLASDCM